MLVRAFESKRECVVMARSNRAEDEVNTAECEAARVPVLRRRGGGGTVVLGPGCQILTVAFFAKSYFDNDRYFSAINNSWISALHQAIGPDCPALVQRGISDVAVGERKVAGTSLFRRKHLVVFQGSLLVCPDIERIAKFLRHPTREPDYRQGRDHLSFVTSLAHLGVQTSVAELSAVVESFLAKDLALRLGDELWPGWDADQQPKE
jgi:lipoate-protein ligase A